MGNHLTKCGGWTVLGTAGQLLGQHGQCLCQPKPNRSMQRWARAQSPTPGPGVSGWERQSVAPDGLTVVNAESYASKTMWAAEIGFDVLFLFWVLGLGFVLFCFLTWSLLVGKGPELGRGGGTGWIGSEHTVWNSQRTNKNLNEKAIHHFVWVLLTTELAQTP